MVHAASSAQPESAPNGASACQSAPNGAYIFWECWGGRVGHRGRQFARMPMSAPRGCQTAMSRPLWYPAHAFTTYTCTRHARRAHAENTRP
jgi:hypothetical protein